MLSVIVNIFLIVLIIIGLAWMHKRAYSFSIRVFCAMAMGLIFGSILQWLYGSDSSVITQSSEYFNIIGSGYIALLKMTIMPLILISIIAAIVKMPVDGGIRKVLILVVGLLVGMTAIAALISIAVTYVFHLDASALLPINQHTQPTAQINQHLHVLHHYSIPQMLVDFIPANPFLDLTGQRSTSVIATVIFAGFLGFSSLATIKAKPIVKERLISGIEIIQSVIVTMVRIVLQLTPYGVAALMTKMAATSHPKEMLSLISFISASYVALFLMFLVHLLVLFCAGVSPLKFIKNAGAVIAFAFASRSSAGAIPLNIDAQTSRFNVPEGIANFSASIGATVGQNGCAGVYPAMLAVMVAPVVGINPIEPGFISMLVLVIAFSSFGVAGIGGGATFAALMVLSTLNLPVALVGLLIAVEPFIDMGRTALNVSGSMTAGIVTSRVLQNNDEEIP